MRHLPVKSGIELLQLPGDGLHLLSGRHSGDLFHPFLKDGIGESCDWLDSFTLLHGIHRQCHPKTDFVAANGDLIVAPDSGAAQRVIKCHTAPSQNGIGC